MAKDLTIRCLPLLKSGGFKVPAGAVSVGIIITLLLSWFISGSLLESRKVNPLVGVDRSAALVADSNSSKSANILLNESWRSSDVLSISMSCGGVELDLFLLIFLPIISWLADYN